ncbi:MAG TPA: NAD(+)/NADH kinase [Gemmatimonadales bacterium]|nr:NAD(+)/NADH kinase [Gemmatimonadales bacterium]
MNVGVVGNPRYEDLAAVLGELAREAPARGLSLSTEPRLDPFWPSPVPHFEAGALDALLTFGGDGTLLRGARLLEGADAPILGVNLGRVGFLTAARRESLCAALDALKEGRYAVDALQALTAQITRADGTVVDVRQALNDVVLHKSGVARVVRMHVRIDGINVGPYSADGLIVSTPTGSTAYSLSAGGPVVVPGVEAMLLTPICAHTLAVRPLLVRATSVIEIEPMAEWADNVLVSFDGQTGSPVGEGGRVEVRRADHRVKLVRLGEASWLTRMRDKLHWGDLSGREPGA